MSLTDLSIYLSLSDFHEFWIRFKTAKNIAFMFLCVYFDVYGLEQLFKTKRRFYFQRILH